MPKVKQEHLDTRRRQILDAAALCFAREGFGRATMRHIIDESGLSAGGIYIYFASKEAIIAAIAADRHARETALIDAAAEERTLQDVVHRLVAEFFGGLSDPAERADRRLGVQLWAEALRSPEILEVVRQGIDVPIARLSALIAEAQQRGDIESTLDPDAAARMVIALFHGFILQGSWDDTLDMDTHLPHIESAVGAILGMH